MSSDEQPVSALTPWGQTVKHLLDAYGLGAMFCANVLGAGSVYILAQTGASTGFALLWVLPLAFVVDLVMHDMSSRMAARGRPLMSFIRDAIGKRPATGYAITMALVMQLWSVANYAVAGYAAAWFIGWNELMMIPMVAFIAILLIYTGTYDQVEAVIGGLLVIVFGVYAALVVGVDASVTSIGAGFIPQVSDATLVIAMLGTTVYYPNFFIQSSMRPTKDWTDLSKYRRDNIVGVAFSVIVSAGMLIVAAVALSPGEMTLVEPARPLVEMIGGWTLPVFMVAVFAASFTSGTGTLFGSGFAVPQALGHRTEFGDRLFKATVVTLISLSSIISVYVLSVTEMTPVRMAITMPAVNGLIYLPLTLLAMYAATRHEMGRKQEALTVVTLLVMFAGSVLTAQSLYDTVIAWT